MCVRTCVRVCAPCYDWYDFLLLIYLAPVFEPQSQEETPFASYSSLVNRVRIILHINGNREKKTNKKNIKRRLVTISKNITPTAERNAKEVKIGKVKGKG